MGDEMMDDDVVEKEQVETTEEEDGELSGDFSDSQVSLSAKDEERQRLQSEVEAYLARGGKIQVVESDVLGDPPKKPESNYGGQPI